MHGPTRGLLVAAVLAAAACGVPPGSPPQGPQSVTAPLVWPESPDRPRIRFVKTVASRADLGLEPSFWERLGTLLAGRDETWVIRPTGVVVQGDVLFIADPGAQALWILDGPGRRFKRVRGLRGEPLASPVAVTLGPRGKVFVADSYLRKVFVFDGQGATLGSFSSPKFQRPSGVAYDAAADRLYVADSAAHRIWVFSGDGTEREVMGSRGTGDGEFNYPSHVGLDSAGTLYVTDSLGFRIQLFARDGRFLGAFGRHGDGSGDFAAPKGVAVDSEGHLYVVDALFDTVQIFDRSGRHLLSFGQRGVRPGQFWLPNGLFIDERDRIYVADSYNQRIQIFQYLREGDDGRG